MVGQADERFEVSATRGTGLDGGGAELRFPAMGTRGHVIVTGSSGQIGALALARLGQLRIADLESKWSRFLPHSELSALNAARRSGCVDPPLSADTVLLLERAEEGRALTGGRFDPHVLRAVQRAGYDQHVTTVPAVLPEPAEHAHEFDPGGIGKGLAADLVAADLMDRGADGVLVNLGGDLRVCGTAPGGGDWVIDIDHPRTGGVIATVALAAGAVATSSQLKRRWVDDDGHCQHHLIDPDDGQSARSPVLSATVIAAHGWQAEVLAKPLLLDWTTGAGRPGSYRDPLEIIEAAGSAALVVTDTVVASSSRWSLFAVGDPQDPVSDSDSPRSEWTPT